VFLIQRLFASGGTTSFDEALPQHWRTTMPTTDRTAAILAILLGALMLLVLSACGTPDNAVSAAQLAGAATTTATANATLTPTLPADDTNTASSATASATAIAETTPVTTSTEVTPTATATPEPVDDTDPFTGTDDLTDTEDLTVTVELTDTHTLTSTQPVALAIADAFGVPVSEVLALHADGLGFGEIARAYFLARELAADADPTNDLTAAQILAMHQSGQGWGQIVAALGLPRGNSHRNLGLIMRAHKAPQQTTADATPSATDGDDHGPAAPPPGQTKHDDKGKDKEHGNGNGNGHGNDKGNGGKKDK
jgi:hypothetical protein